MENIFTFIQSSTPEKKNKNGILLDSFLSFLNPPRLEKGFLPISHSRLSRILKDFDSWGKSIFLGSCLDSQNPSAYFWWYLKNKKGVDK